MAMTRGNIALLSLSTIVSIVVVEAILRAMAPIPDPYQLHKRRANVVQMYLRSSFPANMRVQLSTEAGLPGMDGRQTTFTTNTWDCEATACRSPNPTTSYASLWWAAARRRTCTSTIVRR